MLTVIKVLLNFLQIRHGLNKFWLWDTRFFSITSWRSFRLLSIIFSIMSSIITENGHLLYAFVAAIVKSNLVTRYVRDRNEISDVSVAAERGG